MINWSLTLAICIGIRSPSTSTFSKLNHPPTCTSTQEPPKGSFSFYHQKKHREASRAVTLWWQVLPRFGWHPPDTWCVGPLLLLHNGRSDRLLWRRFTWKVTGNKTPRRGSWIEKKVLGFSMGFLFWYRNLQHHRFLTLVCLFACLSVCLPGCLSVFIRWLVCLKK